MISFVHKFVYRRLLSYSFESEDREDLGYVDGGWLIGRMPIRGRVLRTYPAIPISEFDIRYNKEVLTVVRGERSVTVDCRHDGSSKDIDRLLRHIGSQLETLVPEWGSENRGEMKNDDAIMPGLERLVQVIR